MNSREERLMGRSFLPKGLEMELKRISVITAMFMVISSYGNDSTIIDQKEFIIEERLKLYEARIAQVEANGSNYRIENELLKETYSVNFKSTQGLPVSETLRF